MPDYEIIEARTAVKRWISLLKTMQYHEYIIGRLVALTIPTEFSG